MFGRAAAHTTTTHEATVKGPSLARGPAWTVGLVLSIAGLALFFRAPGTPLGTGSFPDGAAIGRTFLGFEANAWTAWGTTAAGVLVLIGAAQHALAKLMSLIAGAALVAAAIFAFADGDVLGLAAANTWTALGWAVTGGILLVTALLPRVERDAEVIATQERIVEREQPVAEPAGSVPAADAHGAPGQVRSAPLRRTYREPATTGDEVEAARRAEAEEAARRR